MQSKQSINTLHNTFHWPPFFLLAADPLPLALALPFDLPFDLPFFLLLLFFALLLMLLLVLLLLLLLDCDAPFIGMGVTTNFC